VSRSAASNRQPTLFSLDGLDLETDWRPPSSLPDLGRYDEVWFDTETTGTNTAVDKPVGIAIATPDDHCYYLPFGHRGGNLDPDVVRRWARSELKNKTLIGSWIKFDAHMFRNWGLALHELNVQFRDVQHQACLLNERRRKSGLDLLSAELLGAQKLSLPFDPSRMAEAHSSLVGAYAERDVWLTRGLDLAQRPMIEKEDLGRVLCLEDSLIEVVVEMEANGSPIDLEKLQRWRVEVRRQWEAGLKELRELAGFPVNPDSHPDLTRLFGKWGLHPPIDEVKGTPTFAAGYLAPIKYQHAGISLVMRTRALGSLLSKFLDKYPKVLRADGRIRYNLHQLRADDYGTITGRFSSAGDEHGGINVQQVFHPENQEKKLGSREFLIRELHVPAAGLWLSADAAQIEYRLFAGLAANPQVLTAYAADPDVDFHQLVTDICRATAVPDATRKHMKNVNFAKVYGAGKAKIRRMLGTSDEQAEAFITAYDRTFPEVSAVIDRVSLEIRRRHRLEGCGYVRTLLGRRRRYPDLERLHSGLNAHIQGTAADINKIKLRQVYDARRDLEITMRFTVHDELDGDIPSVEHARRLRDLLNEPALPDLKVPIRWSVGVGPNWAEVADL
jgi:DNA polymerase-1